MVAVKSPLSRCAIYTRKSSDEGLEQSFNSLAAQREACVFYVESQRHEGWTALPTIYDDGGYSGGTAERPALKALLADIEAGKVDTVVVYKVDRLSRSLTDFAKIMELFDIHQVSFVSVTQHFNTTTSMGRLTLNVLLSFAQFEREVTGERIRDKIAASKKKGMWMGGTVPLGYDTRDRKLVINKEEAKQVCWIYERYLALGSVTRLKAELDEMGRKSKLRFLPSGVKSGGGPFWRGALYTLLRNRIYVGEICHRKQVYPGQHEGIVSRDLWEKVQAKLESNRQLRRIGAKTEHPSLLAGLIYDEKGNRMTPHHTVKSGKRYRYYVCQAVIQGLPIKAGIRRIPAHDIETIVQDRLKQLLDSRRAILEIFTRTEDVVTHETIFAAAQQLFGQWTRYTAPEIRSFLLSIIEKIIVYTDRVEIFVSKEELRCALLKKSPYAHARKGRDNSERPLHLTVSARLHRGRNGQLRLTITGTRDSVPVPQRDPALIKAVVRGYSWYEKLVARKVPSIRALAKELGLNERYVSYTIQCGLLAPDIVEMILEGRQPPTLTVTTLFKSVAINWKVQRKTLGL